MGLRTVGDGALAKPLIEEVESYWDRRPCNIRHSPLPRGTLAWSQQITARKNFVEPHIVAFADFARWKDKRVLEIGCGIGTDTMRFLRAGAAVDAVELSSESMNAAHERVGLEFPNERPSLRLFHANAEEWLPEGPYDLVYSFGVLHHTPHPERALRLAHERLKTEGELRIMLYATWALKNFLRQQPEAQGGCPLAKRYTAREARKLLAGCGFRAISIHKAHIFPYRVKDYVEYRYVKQWPFRIMPQPMFAWLESALGNHLLIVGRKA